MAGKKRRKKRLKPESLESRRFKSDIRTTFLNCGFEHIPTLNKDVVVCGHKSDIDSLYMFDNIIVAVEDTCTTKQENIVEHLRKKHEFFSILDAQKDEFISVLSKSFPKFRGYLRRHADFGLDEYKVAFLYCSKNNIEKKYRSRVEPLIKFFRYSDLQYFLRLSRTIHKTARFELLKFLQFELSDIGHYRNGQDSKRYKGILLPETPSGFPNGHKLVSFLVDPAFLLEQAYVLRADSWQDTDCLYQRLLVKNKIVSMREYLSTEGRVFVNNIIATLPSSAKLYDNDRLISASHRVTEIKEVTIEIPKSFNSVGIIDGQHRVFSYHEGNDTYDRKISGLREKQHLLVTGIVYPENYSLQQKAKFEANLFLEINDKQKRVRGDLKQSIERIINPASPTAIAKSVIQHISDEGPLAGVLEVHFYDTGKIKTTSIVSYGLKHIVSIDGDHSFFKVWRNTEKSKVRHSKAVLDSYIQFCAKHLNTFFSAFRNQLGDDLWTTDKKVSRALTTTTVNGLIYCMRMLIENRKVSQEFSYYRQGFAQLQIDFRPGGFDYTSSNWKSLGEKIYEACFK